MVGAMVMGVTGAAILTFLVNVPLGYWRATLRKLSWQWFLAIHISIPFVVAMRLVLGISWLYVPLFIALAVAGQVMGSRIRSRVTVVSHGA